MSFVVCILPSGHLYCTADNHFESKIVSAFENDIGEGLFTLAVSQNNAVFSGSARYWREFACTYMTERCHTPGSLIDSTPGLTLDLTGQLERIVRNGETQQMLLNAPPMRGAEYLSTKVLDTAWNTLDCWVCNQVKQSKTGLAGFLKKRAPQWRQVGRVCFHLAENSSDRNYPFAFLATYAPEISQQGKILYRPLGNALQAYAGVRNKKALIHLLSPVQNAAQSSEFIKNLVDSGDIYHPLAWSPGEAHQFIREVPLYEAAGLVVRLPDWWKKRPRARVNITLGSSTKTGLGTDGILSFNLSIGLGEHTLTPAEWKKLMAAQDDLVLLKGQWVEIDKEKLSQVLQHWRTIEKESQQGGLSFIEGMRLLAGTSTDLSVLPQNGDINTWSVVKADRELAKILDALHDPDTMPSAQPGVAFRGTLRPYQATGVDWLWYLSQLGLGACLADDMGLGKTIQIIALLIHIKNTSKKKSKNKKIALPSLLVLPASLLNNWNDELAKFAPTLTCQFIHSSLVNKEQLNKLKESTAPLKVDVVLTSYGMLLRQPWLLNQHWQLVVLDEAQAIKNPNTRITKMVKQLNSQARIALTGTPVENRLGDLWSLFDFLNPGLLGTAAKFKKFTKSLEAAEQSYAPLRKLLHPYILRRLKTDKSIIDDLPDKTEVYAYCGLSKIQAALYQKSAEDLISALNSGVEGIKRRGLVLSFILRFKQICNHPSQLKADGEYQAKDSGKFMRLGEICEEIASRQQKVLIFTQFREMTDPLALFLAQCFGRPGLVLHGGTPVRQRKNMVDHFQAEEGPPFFVLSIRAGGTGLNLTAASHVIHFDRWWNPAVENQATDRAFRIGQKQNVLVHKFVCKGTIEEKIDALMIEKKNLSDDLLENHAQSTLTEMSNDELMDFLKLEI